MLQNANSLGFDTAEKEPVKACWYLTPNLRAYCPDGSADALLLPLPMGHPDEARHDRACKPGSPTKNHFGGIMRYINIKLCENLKTT